MCKYISILRDKLFEKYTSDYFCQWYALNSFFTTASGYPLDSEIRQGEEKVLLKLLWIEVMAIFNVILAMYLYCVKCTSRSPVFSCKSRVLYPGPRFLSSAA